MEEAKAVAAKKAAEEKAEAAKKAETSTTLTAFLIAKDRPRRDG